jgi:hypothetical protein
MNKQNEMAVVTHEAGAVMRPSMPTINIEALINKAVDSKAAVEVVKELRAMLREDQAIAAAQAFDEAMSAFQAECPVIIKGKGVPDRSGSTAYKYAPIEKIEEVIRPIERSHGFTHTFNQDVTSQPGWVIASVTITHTLGHNKTAVGKFPLGTRTAIMSDTQQYAAALTFANRRVLGNAYGLVFSGEDKDGGNPPKASATGRVVTHEIRSRFFEVTKDIHQKILQWAIDEAVIMPDGSMDDLPDSIIPTTKGELEKFRQKVEAHQ